MAFNYICLDTHTTSEKNKLKKTFNITTQRNAKDICHDREALKKCFWCKYLNLDYAHYIFDQDSHLVCPGLR